MQNEFKLGPAKTLVISTENTQHTGFKDVPHVGIEVLTSPTGLRHGVVGQPAPVHPDSMDGFAFVSEPCDGCGKRVMAIDAPGTEHHRAAYVPVVSDLSSVWRPATIHDVSPDRPIAWEKHECPGFFIPEILFAHTFKPSEARAIASMILLAANEARG